jgi:hypothetical protein
MATVDPCSPLRFVNLTKIRHLEARRFGANSRFSLYFHPEKRLNSVGLHQNRVRGEATWAGSGGWIIRIDKVAARYTIGGAGNIGNL